MEVRRIEMRWMIALLAVLLTAEPMQCWGEHEVSQKKLSDEELWDIYYEFVAEVKPYGVPTDRKEHEKKVQPQIVRREQGFDALTRSDRCVELGSRDYMFLLIDDATGEIRFFALCTVNTENYDWLSEGEHKLTEDEALARMRKYLRLNKTHELGDYDARPAFHGESWHCAFFRKLGKYRYFMDDIFVEYSEKYGLTCYMNHLFSDECPTEVKISKEKAVEVASKSLDELRKKAGDIRAELDEPKLLVMNPRYLDFEYSIREWSFEEYKKTRLAWQIHYIVEGNGGRPTRVLQYFIDAATGELLFSSVD